MGKCTFKFVFIHVFLSFFWQPCHSIQLPTDLKPNRGLCGLSLCMLLLPVLSSAGRWRRKTSQVWALLVPKWWWPKPVWSPWIARAGGRRCSAAPPGNQGASSEDAPSPRKTWWRRRMRTVRPGEGGQRQQGVELQEEQEKPRSCRLSLRPNSGPASFETCFEKPVTLSGCVLRPVPIQMLLQTHPSNAPLADSEDPPQKNLICGLPYPRMLCVQHKSILGLNQYRFFLTEHSMFSQTLKLCWNIRLVMLHEVCLDVRNVILGLIGSRNGSLEICWRPNYLIWLPGRLVLHQLGPSKEAGQRRRTRPMEGCRA